MRIILNSTVQTAKKSCLTIHSHYLFEWFKLFSTNEDFMHYQKHINRTCHCDLLQPPEVHQLSLTKALRKDTGTHQLFIHPSSICPHYSVSEACLNSQNGSNVECKLPLVHHAPDLHLRCARFESRPGHRFCDVSSWFLSVPQTKAVPHASNILRPLRYKSFLVHESSCRWHYTVKDTDTIVKWNPETYHIPQNLPYAAF